MIEIKNTGEFVCEGGTDMESKEGDSEGNERICGSRLVLS